MELKKSLSNEDVIAQGITSKRALTYEEVEKMVCDSITKRYSWLKRNENGVFEKEIYLTYDDKLEDSSLAEISNADDASVTAEEKFDGWLENSWYYEMDNIEREIENDFDEYTWEEYQDEIQEALRENISIIVPDSVYAQEIPVVIAIDTGDLNTDFTECNVLNWYGTVDLEEGETPTLPNNSPIRYLAKQQGKLDELEYALTCITRQEDDVMTEEWSGFSRFTKTVIQELQNACSHMNTLIFLGKMELRDYLKIREMMLSEKELNNSYYYDERKGTKSITIKKNADCGLYDPWSGGGSVLEIELEKDVELPIKAIWDAWIDCRGCKANGHGYDVYDVYGYNTDKRDIAEFKEVA